MRPILSIILAITSLAAIAQKGFNDYTMVYPIGEDPNIRYMSSYRTEEKILFEANPIARYSFYNNFIKGASNNDDVLHAWYIGVRPQFRMYSDNSKPVKTPSYRVLLGTQFLFRLPLEDPLALKANFIGFSLESGHYSNGQTGGAFTKDFEDGSVESENIYNLINSDSDLSSMLNRESGNFSTNITELIFNFRSYTLDDHILPAKMHSFNMGALLYHNRFAGIADFGGYSKNDIKLYGRMRYLFGYEYMCAFKKAKGTRISFKQNVEYIDGAHQSVNPLRSESIVTYYPFKGSKTLGLFVTFISGHDNYNFRFVDSGNQVSVGISWSQFPLFAMSKI